MSNINIQFPPGSHILVPESLREYADDEGIDLWDEDILDYAGEILEIRALQDDGLITTVPGCEVYAFLVRSVLPCGGHLVPYPFNQHQYVQGEYLKLMDIYADYEGPGILESMYNYVSPSKARSPEIRAWHKEQGHVDQVLKVVEIHESYPSRVRLATLIDNEATLNWWVDTAWCRPCEEDGYELEDFELRRNKKPEIVELADLM